MFYRYIITFMIKYFFYGLLLYSLSGCNASKKEGLKKRQFTNGLFEIELIEGSEKNLIDLPDMREYEGLGIYLSAKFSWYSQLKITNVSNKNIYLAVQGNFLRPIISQLGGKFLKRNRDYSEYYERNYDKKPDSMRTADRIMGSISELGGCLYSKDTLLYKEKYDILAPQQTKTYNFLHYEEKYVDTMTFSINYLFLPYKEYNGYTDDNPNKTSFTRLYLQRDSVNILKIDSIGKSIF
jgi:hypothetical protein